MRLLLRCFPSPLYASSVPSPLRSSILRLSTRPGRYQVVRLLCLLAMSGIVLILICPRNASAQSPPTASGTAVPAPPKLKADLNRILGGSEYQPESQDQSSANAAAKKFIKDARKRWSDFLKWLGDLFKGGGLAAGSNAITGIIVTLLIAFLIVIVARLFRDWKPNRPAGHLFKNDPSSLEEGQADIIHDPHIWSQQAADWAAKKDYRRAYRALFLAILLQLDAVKLLSYDRARANGDYLRQLGNNRHNALNSALYDMLVPLAGCYDRFWYGRKMAQADDYAKILEVYRALPAFLKSYMMSDVKHYSNLQPSDKSSTTLRGAPGLQSGKEQRP